MTAPLPVARLCHRLTLERAALDADGATVWTAAATLFAALTPLAAGEAEAGGGRTGVVRHRIEMRFRDDVTSRDRLRLGDRLFRILATQDLDERRRRLVVLVEEESR